MGGVSGAGLGEAAHNVQVSVSNDKFQAQLELPGFSPEDFTLKTKDDVILLEAVHETKNEDGSSQTRNFSKEFKMPAGVQSEELASTYSGQGILTITAPRVIDAPEGAEVSEAMKAQSQAFVTEDGTAVKKDEKASNQSIAATTQSEDGSTISSFKSTSSSSSSSTMMSSGGPMPGSMMSMGGGMGGNSLMGGGMGGNSLMGGNMDDMMSKMMSNMGSMDMGSSSSTSKMSSSSFSSSSFSSSSSSSSSMMSNMLGSSGGMSLPPMRGIEMPGFPSMPGMTIEEMSSTPTPANTPAPETPYTVTSPTGSRTHTVQATQDYKAPHNNEADTSVLLQYKTGSDYKLALNMQQFGPDDITIKLNGRELTIQAENHGEKFRQSHTIPDNIDLDEMTSSFSSDGVLVIKAPKK